MQVVEWFCSSPTQVSYVPELHGTPCEWLADLISVTFAEIRSAVDAADPGLQGFCLEVSSPPLISYMFVPVLALLLLGDCLFSCQHIGQPPMHAMI